MEYKASDRTTNEYKTAYRNIDDFVKYAKEEFGYDVVTKEGDKPDTFDSLFSFTNSPCDTCSNNPKNGGSGICHCTLGTLVIY